MADGLRLGLVQEERLRAWPKDRIRPKSVALGLISLLAEVDALRAALEAVTAERDELAEEVQRLQVDGGAYDTGYRRAAEAARQAIEEARGERDAFRLLLIDVRAHVHMQEHGGYAAGAVSPEQCDRWVCGIVNGRLARPPAAEQRGEGEMTP